MAQGFYNDALAAGGLAVVTGAASGVGLVAAKRFAEAGLGVVLADFPGDALDAATGEVQALAKDGASITAVPTDVSDDAAVEALAEKVFSMGDVAVLMNNAGISRPVSSWEGMDNLRQLIEVNLLGVVRGIHAFLPKMLDAGRPAVVINTGSKQGITTPPGNPGYNLTKAGVKIVSEQLAHDMRDAEAPISVHLFVPGFTYTGMIQRVLPEKPASAWTSEETVDYFIGRMAEGDFYILCPDNDVSETRDRRRAAWAVGDIIENRPALSRWHPDYADAFKAFEAKDA